MNRRSFSSLVCSVPVLSTIVPANASGMHAQFARDVARSYESQIVAVDMEDVAAIFSAVRLPVLGPGVAFGADRAAAAALAAIRHAGSVGPHTLMVVAVRPGEGRLLEYKSAMNVLRAHAPIDAVVIYGACKDAELPVGALRVAMLTG